MYFCHQHAGIAQKKKKCTLCILAPAVDEETQTCHILQAASAVLHEYLSSVLPPLALAFIFFLTNVMCMGNSTALFKKHCKHILLQGKPKLQKDISLFY